MLDFLVGIYRLVGAKDETLQNIFILFRMPSGRLSIKKIGEIRGHSIYTY